MRIGIDIQTTLGQKTGFGIYVKNLIEYLTKIDQKNQYFFFKPSADKDLSAPQRLIWDQWQIPQKAKNANIDIFHQPCFSAPIFYRGKVIVTVHDLIALLYGKDIPIFSRQYFGRWMPFTYQFADKIICDSHNTKKDIIKFLRIPEEKLRVIYLSSGSEYQITTSKDDIQKTKKKYGTGEKYLFHAGTLNPRKNLSFLIKVFSEVVKSYPDYNLVITGKKGWYYEELFTLTRELSLEKKVVFTGYISDQDKPKLYKGASIFLFPSLYEGFGLPPLEAMSLGIPVVSSNTSSLPEVVGDTGILLSPNDELAWVRSIKSILSDKTIQKNLSKMGLEQAKKFSWQRCAEETLNVYEEVYNQNSK